MMQFLMMMMMMMMMMTYFCGMVDLRTASSCTNNNQSFTIVTSQQVDVGIDLGLLKQQSAVLPLHYSATLHFTT